MSWRSTRDCSSAGARLSQSCRTSSARRNRPSSSRRRSFRRRMPRSERCGASTLLTPKSFAPRTRRGRGAVAAARCHCPVLRTPDRRRRTSRPTRHGSEARQIDHFGSSSSRRSTTSSSSSARCISSRRSTRRQRHPLHWAIAARARCSRARIRLSSWCELAHALSSCTRASSPIF